LVTERAESYRVELLGRQHDRTAFSCGVDALDRYFQQQAGQDQRRSVAIPYVLVDVATGRVAGYYTLSTFSIVPERLPEALVRKLPRYDVLPAILVGRLAVDQRYRGQRLGGALLIDALRRCLGISREVGAIGVVVDAKDDSARSFYEHYGFIRLPDQPYCLFLPMTLVEKL
jgi:GNAT superfamily N-acetyltransferase